MAFPAGALKHVREALGDTFVIALVSLLPLLLGRLHPWASNETDPFEGSGYFGFVINGQLAFYAMGTLAAMFVWSLRRKLPEGLGFWIGIICLLALAYLTWTIGIDPNFRMASTTFIGPVSAGIYLCSQILFVIVDSSMRLGLADIPGAGSKSTQRLTEALGNQKNPKGDA